MYDYEHFLTEKLNRINNLLSLNLNIKVASEQAYVKEKTISQNTIYVVIKYLASDITFGAKVQPVQILCISEENSLNKAQELLTKFTEESNFLAVLENSTFTKHQYTSPVVLSNFEEIGFGKRSILYFTGSISILENVIDVNSLKIDGVDIQQLGFTISYQMTPNTQQMNSENIASSVKTVAVLSLGLTIPLTATTVTTKIINIMNGTNNGNQNFNISFNLGEIAFTNFNYKLTSANIITAANTVPSLQIGFIR